MPAKFTPAVDKSGKKVPFLFRKSDSPFYYVRKTFKRYRIKPLFESTKEETIGKARAKAEELINEHLNRYVGEGRDYKSKRFHSRSIASVIDEINRVETGDLRMRTQEHRHLYFNEFKKELGSVDITRMDADRWADWLAGFRKRKNRRTYWDYAKHMNIVLRYAYAHKYVSHMVKLKVSDPAPDEARVFTEEEIGRLYAAMSPTTRDQFVLSYENYMRLREVLHLRWDCVNLETGLIRLKASDVKTGSKTKKGREFLISERALERLQDRRKLMGDTSPYVFPNKADSGRPAGQNITAWIAAKRRAGITGTAKWHSLRHTAITHALLKHGVDIMRVSEFAGVSAATIQKVYLHSTAQQTAVAGQVLRISIPIGCDKGVSKENK